MLSSFLSRSDQEILQSGEVARTEEAVDYHHVLQTFCISLSFSFSIFFIFCILFSCLLWAFVY